MMKKLTDNAVVDIKAEIAAMTTYLAPRWEGIPEPEALISDIQKAAVHAGRFWFADYKVARVLMDRNKARQALLASVLDADEAEVASLFDVPSRMLFSLSTELCFMKSAVQDAEGEWDFCAAVTKVLSNLTTAHPALQNAKPVNWLKALAIYEEHGDMATYAEQQQRKDEAEFEGFDTSAAGGGGFTIRTSLPHVMYDEMEQGRRAVWVLVSAVFSHFLTLQEHINTCALRDCIENLPWMDKQPHMVFETPPIDMLSLHPVLRAALLTLERRQPKSEAGPSPAEQFAYSVKTRRELAKRPPEEQAAVQANGAARLAELMSSLTAKKTPEQRAAEETCRVEEAKFRRQMLLMDPPTC
jgi:hypothetical protein